MRTAFLDHLSATGAGKAETSHRTGLITCPDDGFDEDEDEDDLGEDDDPDEDDEDEEEEETWQVRAR
jgi:hypothetical protein